MPPDASELVRRYRAAGIHSGSHRKRRSSTPEVKSAPREKTPAKRPHHLSVEERRQREKNRGYRRNKRISRHRRLAALKQLGWNLTYLVVAGVVSYLLLMGVLR